MRSRKHVLYTIGYAGHTLNTFIQTLQAKHVSVLLDIRMTPISRKKGFSKSALHQALYDAGITYRHIRTLGSPAELRHSLHTNKDYNAFFASFRAYLQCQEQSLHQAAELVELEQVCLMCVEKCPDECHRSIVADAIVDTLGCGVAIQHLPSQDRLPAKTAMSV